eukprot:gene3300-2282_t
MIKILVFISAVVAGLCFIWLYVRLLYFLRASLGLIVTEGLLAQLVDLVWVFLVVFLFAGVYRIPPTLGFSTFIVALCRFATALWVYILHVLWWLLWVCCVTGSVVQFDERRRVAELLFELVLNLRDEQFSGFNLSGLIQPGIPYTRVKLSVFPRILVFEIVFVGYLEVSEDAYWLIKMNVCKLACSAIYFGEFCFWMLLLYNMLCYILVLCTLDSLLLLELFALTGELLRMTVLVALEWFCSMSRCWRYSFRTCVGVSFNDLSLLSWVRYCQLSLQVSSRAMFAIGGLSVLITRICNFQLVNYLFDE